MACPGGHRSCGRAPKDADVPSCASACLSQNAVSQRQSSVGSKQACVVVHGRPLQAVCLVAQAILSQRPAAAIQRREGGAVGIRQPRQQHLPGPPGVLLLPSCLSCRHVCLLAPYCAVLKSGQWCARIPLAILQATATSIESLPSRAVASSRSRVPNTYDDVISNHFESPISL